MKIKRIIAVALSTVMLGSTATVAAYAEETTPQKTFNYVAFGDSIASGFGLTDTGNLATDPALILTEDLIANPVMEAYPAVFGTYLAEMGAETGYTTTATNLSSTAYRACDIAQTLVTPQTKGEIAEWILETFAGQGTSEPLLAYHDIYNKYLPDADMVSVQLGGNDVIMAALHPMLQTDNPVITSMGLAVILTLFGYDPELAVGAAIQMLSQQKDNITVEDFAEAASFFADMVKNSTTYVDDAVQNVSNMLDAVKSINSTAEIALINMFNPYGNSLLYEGQVRTLCNVVKNVFIKAAKEVFSIEINVEPVEPATDEEIAEGVENVTEISAQLEIFVASYDRVKELRKQRLQFLLNAFAEEMAYPMQYLLLGKTAAPLLKRLNCGLWTVAENTENCTYVDVYDISNECNLDPHPLASGHKEIADRLWATMLPFVDDVMSGKRMKGDVNLDGVVDVLDVTLLQRYLAEFTDEEGEYVLDLSDKNTFYRCDANSDGKVDIRDISAIQRIIAEFS